jgi:N-acetylmuramoyl-L-alanine amidase
MVFERLKAVKRVIVSIGHGGGDVGAVNNRGDFENKEAYMIAYKVESQLKAMGIDVVIVPDYGLQKTCDYINRIGKAKTDIAFEIHKDSSDEYSDKTMRRRLGFYFHPKSEDADNIACALVDVAWKMGASESSWARPDTQSNHGTLAFIRQPKMLSFIYEAGFIEDLNTEVERLFYASVLVEGIAKILLENATNQSDDKGANQSRLYSRTKGN